MTELVQWHKPGDHPRDHVGEQAPDPTPDDPDRTYTRVEGAHVRFYRRPGIDGATLCPTCSLPMDDHGWIDDGTLDANGLVAGVTVHPGDWIPA
jgi:hypothetical protein